MPGGAAPTSQQFSGAPGPKPSRAVAVESWTATAADVDAWLSGAKPGERFVYCKGPSLVHGAAAARVRQLQDAGEVTAHNRRDPQTGGFEYLIIRHRPPPPPAMPPVCTNDMLKVLVEVQADAAAGRRCRSNDDLAQATDLSRDQVRWQIEKLEKAKMITRRVVPIKGDAKFRVITVVATGMSTAEPAK